MFGSVQRHLVYKENGYMQVLYGERVMAGLSIETWLVHINTVQLSGLKGIDWC